MSSAPGNLKLGVCALAAACGDTWPGLMPTWVAPTPPAPWSPLGRLPSVQMPEMLRG